MLFNLHTHTHFVSHTHMVYLILSKQTFYHTSSFTSAYFTYTSSTSPFKHAPKPSIGLSMKPSSLPWNHRVPQILMQRQRIMANSSKWPEKELLMLNDSTLTAIQSLLNKITLKPDAASNQRTASTFMILPSSLFLQKINVSSTNCVNSKLAPHLQVQSPRLD